MWRRNAQRLLVNEQIVQQRTMSIRSLTRPASVDYSSLGEQDRSQPPWRQAEAIRVTRNAAPDWKFGQGALDDGQSLNKEHIEIDPFEPGRPMFKNFSLLVSGIVPRPIGFASTLSKDGSPNLAPFSYFQVVDHDPPVFVIGFSGRADRPKDTRLNLEDNGEVVLNMVSEHMMEAVNASSLDAPVGTSEWNISGLHQAVSTTVKPARVKESIFSVEGKLIEILDYKTTRQPEGPHGKLAIIEGTRFWVREDALDEEQRKIDLEVFRPIAQLGGIRYARMTDTFDLARSNWTKAMESSGSQLKALTNSK